MLTSRRDGWRGCTVLDGDSRSETPAVSRMQRFVPVEGYRRFRSGLRPLVDAVVVEVVLQRFGV